MPRIYTRNRNTRGIFPRRVRDWLVYTRGERMNAIATIRQAPALSFDHQVQLANSFAKSGLFGIKSADQALALMALCEAEGMHPAIAVRDYHIIQGKPALKADAMLARFQAAGGRVKWLEMSDERVSAEFSHPAGGSVTIDWDKARAQTAGFWGKDNWKKFPRAMLRARVVSEGIRTVFPGVVVGVYTPEEVQDFDDKPTTATVVSQSPIEADDGQVALWHERLGACETLDDLAKAWKETPAEIRRALDAYKNERKQALQVTA